MRILVDSRERDSGMPTLLASIGTRVEVRRLHVGDYHVGNGAIVERKTVRGFHLDVVEGRLWRQLGLLRRAARMPYLLVEGIDLDEGRLAPSAVRAACLAAQDLGVALIRSADARDSARWLHELAKRRQNRSPRYRPRFAQRPKSPSGPAAAEAALAAVPSISTVTAERS